MRCPLSIGAFLALVMLSALAGTAPVTAQSTANPGAILLEPAPPPSGYVARRAADQLEVRSRYVYVRTNLLAGESAPLGAERVVLNFFDDTSVVAVRDRFEKVTDGLNWYGHVDGKPKSSVVISVSKGAVAANARFDGKLFQIRLAALSVHRSIEIDPTRFPRENCDQAPAPDSANPAAPEGETPSPIPSASTTTETSIDVLVVYTHAAASGAKEP